MVHTDPDKIKSIFDVLIDFTTEKINRGSIEFGYKLGKEDQLSFYVTEPSFLFLDQSLFEKEFNAEAELISCISEKLERLGGRVWIDHNPESGRTFWFTIDIQPPGRRKRKYSGNRATLPSPDWSGRTILIVDDVRTNLILLENFLIPTKARVISVDNGLKAVNAVKKGNSIDFVLMDVRMPVLDGYEATRRIKRIKPWLPVVAISAYPDSGESQKWKDAGCDAFLGKPLNSNDLIGQMTKLFGKVSMQT
jgi:CheY-like chemotaxis protein